MQIKGRKPIETKPVTKTMPTPDELFGNALKVDATLDEELASQGLEGRWVDYKKLVEFAGYHKNGWVPYKRLKNDTISSMEFKYGNDPDGLVRRGTVVLAVKPKEKAEVHRNYLRLRAEAYGSSINKQQADELRKMLRQNNIKSEVLEGFDETNN